MTPTRQELKVAIEAGIAAIEYDPMHAYDGCQECANAAILRAMLETFDDREDVLEAAMRESRAEYAVGEEATEAHIEESADAIMARRAAYRRLDAKRKGASDA